MANPTSNIRSAPRPARVPAERAQGLDPEFTAQPRPLSDELSMDSAFESGLSVDPDELGSRFLAEATEQSGVEAMRTALENELAIVGPAAGDGAIESGNFDPDNSLWEQTVDLTMQTLGSADQLRSPPFISDTDADDDDELDDLDPDQEPVRSTQNVQQEGSLLDYPTGQGDQTREPEIEPEDAGRHARSTARGALGAQVELDMNQSGVRYVQWAAAQPAAPSGRGSAGSLLRRVLLRSAAALRVAARRLTQRG